MCISRFIEACKYKHALAFFQWRSKYGPTNHLSQLEEIFAGRIQHLKDAEDKISNSLTMAENGIEFNATSVDERDKKSS